MPPSTARWRRIARQQRKGPAALGAEGVAGKNLTEIRSSRSKGHLESAQFLDETLECQETVAAPDNLGMQGDDAHALVKSRTMQRTSSSQLVTTSSARRSQWTRIAAGKRVCSK